MRNFRIILDVRLKNSLTNNEAIGNLRHLDDYMLSL